MSTEMLAPAAGDARRLGQRRILEMVATGAPLDDVLGALMRWIEAQEPGMIAGLLLTDDGIHFRPGSGPNIPAAYKQALHEAIATIPITPPYFASCAEAVDCGRAILIPDVAKDSAYQRPWRDLMLASGLRAVRWTPVRASDGHVLGCLALYFNIPRDPTPADPELVKVAAHLAAIAIEHDQTETALRRSEAWLAGQKEAFQAAVSGAPLEASLGVLVRTAVEQAGSEVRAAFYIVDPDGARLHHVIGMPEAYARCVAGFEIGPDSLACGLAAYRKQPVITPDVAEDPRWESWLWLAREHGYRACWSFPVETVAGKVVGTFSMYYREPRNAAPRDLDLAAVLTHAAAIIISRHQEAEERARSESALHEREARLRAIFNSTVVGAATLTPTWHFIQVNDAFRKITGYSQEELVSIDCGALLHPDDRPQMRELSDDLLTGRIEAFVLEQRYVRRDGALIWVESSVSSTRDAAGRPLHLVALCQEVTERKRAAALSECQRQALQMLAEGAPLDDVLEVLLRRTEGHAADGMLGSILLLDHAGTHFERSIGPSLPSGFNSAVAGTAVASMIGTCCRAVALREPVAVADIGGDRQWAAFAEFVAPYGLCAAWSTPIFGSDGRVLGTFANYYRRPRDPRPRDLHWVEVVTRTAAIAVERALAEAELRDLNDSLERRVGARTRELEDAVAERRKVEAAMHQAQRLEAIGQLTGGVAHDFNNLLTVVVGQSEAIAAGVKDDGIRRRAKAIQRAAERGARLTGQLLSFARRQRLSPETVRIGTLIANIDDLVRRAVGEPVAVEFGADFGLWPSLIDPAQFESAILNLALNARDAMPEGGRLAITAKNAAVANAEATRLDIPPGDYVVVTVTDSGTGMTAAVREHAFEPFFTTKDVGKGTGLGLAQIYGFVRQSGGAVALESALGKGTTVSLYLPRVPTVAAEEPPVPSAATSTAAGQSKTILVVEDQPDIREVIEASLSDLGYRTLMASDGIEACKVLKSDERIDLLLTDLVMPNGVSGLELVEGAKRLRRDLKIVLVSGYSRDPRLRAASQRGDFLFLEKPFRQAELARTIAAALGAGHE